MRTAVAVIVAGCSYPEFGFPSQPAPDTAVADSSSIVSDASDATRPLFDAVEQDAAPKRGCAALGMHLLCRDFDSSTKPTDGWKENAVSALGSLTLVPSDHSSPNALLAETRADPAGIQVAHVDELLMAPTADTVARVDLWMKLEIASIATSGGYLFKWARAGDGVTLSIGSSGFYVETRANDYPVATAVPVGKWFHVRMESKLHPTTGWFSLYINDMATPVLKKTDIATSDMVSTERRLAIGLYANKNAATLRAYYDDVTLDWL